METIKIKPSQWLHIIPFSLIIGAVLVGLLIDVGVLNMKDRLQRVIVPGENEIVLSESGEYTIFYEYQSIVDGKSFSTEEKLPNLEYKLIAKTTGFQIPLTSTGSRQTTYEGPSHSGVSALNFNIESPGIYEFSAWYPNGQNSEKIIFAIGQKLPIAKFFGSIALIFLMVIAGVIIFIVIFMKRQKAKKMQITPTSDLIQ